MENRRALLLSAVLLLPSSASAEAEAAKAVASDVDEIPQFETKPRPNDVAVVIGIEDYRDLPASKFSAADAKLFSDYLIAMGYPARNVNVLLNERATRTDLGMALEGWLPNRVKPDSRVVVYFSGHGSPEPARGEAYLVPYDGNANYLATTAYPLKRLEEQLGALKAAEVMVFLDSCFSGAGGRSVLAEGARPLVTSIAPMVNLGHRMAVMTAAQDTQISTSSPERGHGLFTYHLLKAFRAGRKGVGEIFEHLRPLVEDDARALNVEQTPTLAPKLPKAEGRFLVADFARVILPEEKKKDEEMSAEEKAALDAERARIESDKAALEAEKKRMAEEAARKEKELAAERERMEADRRRAEEAQRRREAEERERLAREKRELERRERELKRKRTSYENVPPPP